jgi:hypothetical protein
MRWPVILCLTTTLLLSSAGCPLSSTTTTSGNTNPFLTLTEQQLIESNAATPGGGTSTGGGTAAATVFRRVMTVTFANNNSAADLSFNFLAWVDAGSINTAGQQDALWDSGYIQLTRSLKLGPAYTLAPATFIYSPEGTAAATRVSLLAAAGTTTTDTTTPTTATETTHSLLTPDVILVFLDPPDSCDSTAFEYSDEGDVLTSAPFTAIGGVFGGATTTGGFKTLAQINVYQCDPFQPGLFLKHGGGSRSPNQYFEGEDARVEFNRAPDAAGMFALVEFLGPNSTTTTPTTP